MMKMTQLKKNQVENIDQKIIFELLQSSEKGLSQKTAEKRLVLYGQNTLKKYSVSVWEVLFRQLKNSLIYLLIVASVLSFWVNDYSDATIILAILLINTSLGFFQEYKSEKIIEKLSRFITMQVRVRRDDNVSLVDQTQLVPGDIIIVHEGDIVPADMKLLEATNLQVNESQLTGESVPIIKNSKDILFTGSVIEKGMAIGIIYATGENTEYGTIAVLSRETKKQTQYVKSLQDFSSFLIKTILLGLTLVFISKLILDKGIHNSIDLLIFIIATAVAVVPEVLPVITTVSLSSGALKLAKKHVVVKRLSSLEDFGNVDLLCTDKTGTITENKMVINQIISIDPALFQKFAYAAIVHLKGEKRRTQNKYDVAFSTYVSDDIKHQAKSLTILKELPFDPEGRRRIILRDGSAKQFLIVIGAPEALFNISAPSQNHYAEEIQSAGRQGLHTLAIAYKEIQYDSDYDILNSANYDLFLGSR